MKTIVKAMERYVLNLACDLYDMPYDDVIVVCLDAIHMIGRDT